MKIRLKWGDFAIIGAVLLLAAGLFAALVLQTAGDTLYAEVWQNDTCVARVQLTDDTDRVIDVDGHNHVVLRGKTATMLDADCADQVCVRTGTLTRAGQSAVCLPNRVIVKLIGAENEVDAIVS